MCCTDAFLLMCNLSCCRMVMFEYSLLVNLKMLDDLQLSRQISIESLHNKPAQTASKA